MKPVLQVFFFIGLSSILLFPFSNLSINSDVIETIAEIGSNMIRITHKTNITTFKIFIVNYVNILCIIIIYIYIFVKPLLEKNRHLKHLFLKSGFLGFAFRLFYYCYYTIYICIILRTILRTFYELLYIYHFLSCFIYYFLYVSWCASSLIHIII